MKVDSKEVVSSTVQDLIKVVKKYVEQLQIDVGVEYQLTEIRVNLKEDRVFVVWEDYSEEEKRTEELIREYMSLKKQITDPLSEPTLYRKLMDVVEEFYELTNVNIEEVIG